MRPLSLIKPPAGTVVAGIMFDDNPKAYREEQELREHRPTILGTTK